LKKKYFSSHKLPKQQSTSFWSQGILGINGSNSITLSWIIPFFIMVFFYNDFFPWKKSKQIKLQKNNFELISGRIYF
jgi:hypothetical protein